jgi:hypothetical protein
MASFDGGLDGGLAVGEVGFLVGPAGLGLEVLAKDTHRRNGSGRGAHGLGRLGDCGICRLGRQGVGLEVVVRGPGVGGVCVGEALYELGLDSAGGQASATALLLEFPRRHLLVVHNALVSGLWFTGAAGVAPTNPRRQSVWSG